MGLNPRCHVPCYAHTGLLIEHVSMKCEFEDSPYTAIYRAEFRARKDAKIARAKAKAVKEEPLTVHQSPSSVPPRKPSSDDEDPLQAWKPRKHRHKQEPSPEIADNDTIVGKRTLLPGSGSALSPATTKKLVVDTTSSELALREQKLNAGHDTTGSPSTRIGPSPKSRQSSGASESLPDQRKRSAGSALFDDRRSSASKQAKRTSTAGPSSRLPILSTVRRTGVDRQPPDWYKALPKPKGTRESNESAAEIALTSMKSNIKVIKASNPKNKAAMLAATSAKIIDKLHKLTFLAVTDKLLRKTRTLDNGDGLPQLFDKAFSGGIDWPWYLQADAEELYNKWCTRIFETDLYRGLQRALKSKNKTPASNYDKLEEGSERFRLVDPKEHGNGLLVNGTWWPTQLAVLRDGGHGSSQAGITSHPVEGAFSVIVSGGLDSTNQPYPNIDNGNEVLYCGTDNHSAEVNEPSRDTRAMILNHENKRPVRLFRSSNLGSPYAPEQGFRYDGLYEVAEIELMDPPEEKRKRHRFRLVRCDAQDPIRYAGLARRPTKEELEEYEKDRKNRGR